MKNIRLSSVIPLMLFIFGCSGEPILNASSVEKVQEFVKNVEQEMNEEQKAEFKKAIMYFSVGGSSGFKAFMLGTNSVDLEEQALGNLKVINGMTHAQIISKYRELKAQDAVKKQELIQKEEQDRKEREQRRQEREEVLALQEEAVELLSKKEFQQAIEKYNKILTYDSGVEVAKEGLAEVKEAASNFKEKMDYIDSIEIIELTAERIDTWGGDNKPAVRIALKNNGNRSLSEVEIIVYFKNTSGDIIYEESFHPIMVTSFSSSRRGKHLKPGYINEMEEGKYFVVDSPITQWKEGDIDYKIGNIEFSD